MKVFIWGMGLIGASLGLRLKELGYQVSGAVRSERSRGVLASLGFTEIYTDADAALAALAGCDVLALGLNIADCYPVLDRVLGDLDLASRLTIFDMCSSKKEICQYVAAHFPEAGFVGTHPMAGKEKQGPESAEASLFAGSTVFLVPPQKLTTEKQKAAYELVTRIWQQAGANTSAIDPHEHDRVMAHVSHGLHLAACLIAQLSGRLETDSLTASPAAGSYRDMTRIVESSGVMWNEITESNRVEVINWLRDLSVAAGELAGQIENGTADIPALFAAATSARHRLMQK